MPETTTNPFDSYKVRYGIVSHDTTTYKDYARIDCYAGETKVGQILFGTSIKPGNNGSIINGTEIHLYFPLSHFANILGLLQLSPTHDLALYLEFDPTGNPMIGGVAVD